MTTRVVGKPLHCTDQRERWLNFCGQARDGLDLGFPLKGMSPEAFHVESLGRGTDGSTILSRHPSPGDDNLVIRNRVKCSRTEPRWNRTRCAEQGGVSKSAFTRGKEGKHH